MTDVAAVSFDWLAWSNPVAVWWEFLVAVSIANITLWLMLHRQFRKQAPNYRAGAFRLDLMVLLSAAYVFGCAFRSVLPRADVQRICLFDTWLSSVMVGRSVATIAEVCFVIQWAIVLRQLANSTRSDAVRLVAAMIVPLILLAECCSWYAVITTSYLGNTIENSLWTATFLLIAAALLRLLTEFEGIMRLALGTAVVGIAIYVAFLITVDVPMYFDRWQADLMHGKQILGLVAGLHDVSTRWAVTHDFARWKGEIPWMSLYFSAAVWSSLALCGFALMLERWPRFSRGAAISRAGVAGRASLAS
ncbi:MAG TPA: hypothetical protein VH934_17880 [Xanthobacteraceae bacterium]|jgi:hypothetical protein